jgi:hypothetical protein
MRCLSTNATNAISEISAKAGSRRNHAERPPRFRRALLRFGLAAPCCHHPQRRDQDALCLLLPQRLPTPASTDRPLPDRTAAPQHVPQATAPRAAYPAQPFERFVHPSPRVELALGELRCTASARGQHHGPSPDRVQSRELKVSLEGPSRIMHGFGNSARPQQRAQTIDRSVPEHDPAVGVDLAPLLERAARPLGRLQPPTHGPLTNRTWAWTPRCRTRPRLGQLRRGSSSGRSRRFIYIPWWCSKSRGFSWL